MNAQSGIGTITTQEGARAAAQAAINANSGWLTDLFCRHLDEKEFEPWSGYAAAIKRFVAAPAGFAFSKATCRPFGFVLANEGRQTITVSLTASGALSAKFRGAAA